MNLIEIAVHHRILLKSKTTNTSSLLYKILSKHEYKINLNGNRYKVFHTKLITIEKTYKNVITVGKFELKNSSRQDATIFLNLYNVCPTNIKSYKDESDNNCIYMTELIRELLSSINYYLAVIITSESVKDLTVSYKYDEKKSSSRSYRFMLKSILK